MILLALAIAALTAPLLRAQSSARPRFEVAAIKPCTDRDSAPEGKRGGAGNRDFSPASLHLDCTTTIQLIRSAYLLFTDGHVNPRSNTTPVDGGPAWIHSDLYRIDAGAGPAAPLSQGAMRGPMLQTLLEERFHLKVHRESREVPAYALVVAKGGPKLRPFREGSCTPLDLKILEQFPPPPFPKLPPGQTYCGGTDPDGSRWVFARATQNAANVILLDARALTVDEFLKHSLGTQLDRPVINRTALSGRFDYHLEFAPPDDNVPAPSIFTALQQQLGLRLDPARGAKEFLIIDHIEKPSAN